MNDSHKGICDICSEPCHLDFRYQPIWCHDDESIRSVDSPDFHLAVIGEELTEQRIQ